MKRTTIDIGGILPWLFLVAAWSAFAGLHRIATALEVLAGLP
jgi:hypothetical protein